MKKILLKNIQNVVVVILISCIIVFAMISYSKSVQTTVDEYAQLSVQDAIQLQKKLLLDEITSDQETLESLSLILGKMEFSYEEIVRFADGIENKSNFYKINIYELDGYTVEADGTTVNIYNKEFFRQALEGKTFISDPFYIESSELYAMVMAAPIYEKGTSDVKYVVVGTYLLEELANMISYTQDYSQWVDVINSKGTLIFQNNLDEYMAKARLGFSADLGSINFIKGSEEQFLSDLQQGNSGVIAYEYNEKITYSGYEPLGINDWFMLLYIDREEIASDIGFKNTNLLQLFLIIIFCLTFLFCYIAFIKNRSKKELYKTENFDELTGLSSSKMFRKEVERILLISEGIPMSCIVVDICNFKLVNDRFGTEVGDQVLVAVGKAFQTLREGSLMQMSACAKLHSDNFAAFLPIRMESSAQEKMDQFVRLCRDNTEGLIEEYQLNFACGRYKIQRGDKAEVIIERALAAHSYAKNKEQNTCVDYDDTFIKELHIRTDILNSFEKALERKEFQVYLQPQYSTTDEKLSGAEALVRWIKNGSVRYYPDVFIPILEETGKIIYLDSYLREEVCKKIRTWLDEGVETIPISVNVSRIELLQEGFVGRLTKLLEKYQIPSILMHIEITERAYVDENERLIKVVEKLRSEKFHIEMDDFGSGYSSLNVLKDIPLDAVKLDMKFVESGKSAAKSGSILSSVIRMAQGIDLLTIAEGVETKAQVDYLGSIGCKFIQGYYYSKPMPMESFEKLLKEEPKSQEKETCPIGINGANSFLDATAQETLLFNTYVGGAAIIEYLDGKLSVLRVNDKYYDAFGIKKGDFDPFKTNILEYVSKESREEIMENIEKAITTGKESSGECCVYSQIEKGKLIWQSYNLRCLTKKGNSYLLYVSLYNITDRKKLELATREKSREMVALYNNMPGGYVRFIEKETEFITSFVSKGICKILGYTNKELLNKNINELVIKEDYEKVVKVQQQAKKEKKSLKVECRFHTKENQVVWFEYTGHWGEKEDGTLYMDCFFYDITAFHKD